MELRDIRGSPARPAPHFPRFREGQCGLPALPRATGSAIGDPHIALKPNPMCGRYLLTSAPEAFRRLFRYREQADFPPRYNVAPTQPVPIVRMAEGERQLALVRWGLIPAWVKDPRRFSLLVN